MQQYHSKLKVGDFVTIRNRAIIGEISKLYNKQAGIICGAITLYVNISELALLLNNPLSQKNYPKKTSIVTHCVSKYKQHNRTIDLHGMHQKEALVAIEQFIDRSLLLQGTTHLKIIHGKGKGILRKVVRDYLYRHDHVKKVIDNHPLRCTAGVTWAEL